MVINGKKRPFKEAISEKAPPTKSTKQTKPVKRDWQRHARDQLKQK